MSTVGNALTAAAGIATAATTAAPAPKESVAQKLENILTGIGKFVEGAINAEINIGIAEKPLLDQFLPANIAQALDTANQVAQATYIQIEAQEQAIGASPAPYATKVAKVIVLQGSAIAKILASAGLESGQAALQTIVTGATAFAQIGVTSITTLQAPAATTTAAS